MTGWRLPTLRPVNGTNFNLTLSSDGSTDVGTAATTTDGADGGWRNDLDDPVSEMGHMYYVTLGNLGFYDPMLPCCSGGPQPGWGLSNTGPFSNFFDYAYWYDTELTLNDAFGMATVDGTQGSLHKDFELYAWAVYSGDVGAVPIPAAIWLFGSGLLGLIGVARRHK